MSKTNSENAENVISSRSHEYGPVQKKPQKDPSNSSYADMHENICPDLLVFDLALIALNKNGFKTIKKRHLVANLDVTRC